MSSVVPGQGKPCQDPFDLMRFVQAQEGVFEVACRELGHGFKQSHWMWFVFPQLRGLGSSPLANRYGIGSLAEARAYLADPLLGFRLLQATGLVQHAVGRSPDDVFGAVDSLKLRSSMTLFTLAQNGCPRDGGEVFQAVLDRYFEGRPDAATLRLIGEG